MGRGAVVVLEDLPVPSVPCEIKYEYFSFAQQILPEASRKPFDFAVGSLRPICTGFYSSSVWVDVSYTRILRKGVFSLPNNKFSVAVLDVPRVLHSYEQKKAKLYQSEVSRYPLL